LNEASLITPLVPHQTLLGVIFDGEKKVSCNYPKDLRIFKNKKRPLKFIGLKGSYHLYI